MTQERMSAEEIAFANLARVREPTEAEIQRGIDATMREVIKSRPPNPNALEERTGGAASAPDTPDR